MSLLLSFEKDTQSEYCIAFTCAFAENHGCGVTGVSKEFG
jgi:hypothetical protein